MNFSAYLSENKHFVYLSDNKHYFAYFSTWKRFLCNRTLWVFLTPEKEKEKEKRKYKNNGKINAKLGVNVFLYWADNKMRSKQIKLNYYLFTYYFNLLFLFADQEELSKGDTGFSRNWSLDRDYARLPILLWGWQETSIFIMNWANLFLSHRLDIFASGNDFFSQ